MALQWNRAFKVPLWPPALFDELQPYLDGLFKIKMFVAQKREGLNACLLPQTTYHVILNNRVVLHCRMQQDTGHRWKRKALHAALARAHEAPSESEPPSAGGDTDPSPHGRPLKATEPPTSFSSALASASGSVDWSIIHDKIPMQRKQQVSLHQWMITLPAPTD